MKQIADNHSIKSDSWYHLIDAIRGFALVNMLLFHFFYDVFIIFGQDTGWYRYPAVRIWQQFICITFLLVSGMSWHFSRNNLKRGIRLNLYGLLITVVTLFFMPSQAVWFGILNCIGCSSLLMIPLHKVFTSLAGRLAPYKAGLSVGGLILALFLFGLTRNVTDGYLSLAGHSINLPDQLYNLPMTILGFPYIGFTSSDYFPILPWFFLFLAGYFSWEVISSITPLLNVFRIKVPFLSPIGNKTIWIYLLHQPLLYALAYLLIQLGGINFHY